MAPFSRQWASGKARLSASPRRNIWMGKCREVLNLALGNLRTYGVSLEWSQNALSRTLNILMVLQPLRSYAPRA